MLYFGMAFLPDQLHKSRLGRWFRESGSSEQFTVLLGKELINHSPDPSSTSFFQSAPATLVPDNLRREVCDRRGLDCLSNNQEGK
ncbi:hypothetical protein Dda_6070 [Drechslerella dactyloides]|uniref:Uncharacterized protein n=1 Tax=Drechslerella dactyloides TaxID=74499 RepID=A0AAD6IVL0_DREDA|nr:hypothetical protein Dda_6070 [Drechslerella dactyloides]